MEGSERCKSGRVAEKDVKKRKSVKKDVIPKGKEKKEEKKDISDEIHYNHDANSLAESVGLTEERVIQLHGIINNIMKHSSFERNGDSISYMIQKIDEYPASKAEKYVMMFYFGRFCKWIIREDKKKVGQMFVESMLKDVFSQVGAEVKVQKVESMNDILGIVSSIRREEERRKQDSEKKKCIYCLGQGCQACHGSGNSE